jgi:hypothetical protein
MTLSRLTPVQSEPTGEPGAPEPEKQRAVLGLVVGARHAAAHRELAQLLGRHVVEDESCAFLKLMVETFPGLPLHAPSKNNAYSSSGLMASFN